VPDQLGVAAINQSLRVKVALDDVTFASGASLVVLTRCHFHAIKLDKSLIDQIGPEQPAPEWLTSIGRMLAASSQLRVIAEGVETEQQVAMLRAANIHAAQGFYFARPMRAAALMAFHRERAIRE
jgi:EAL domain-containing protein (putative c-di-GMP-specific phosphodiesterase class I)